MIKFNKPQFPTVLILLLFVCIFIFLGFGNHLFSGPNGIHFMRQTDSLSFASQYYNNNYHFFSPSLFNLKNNLGNAACEFPITYFITSLLYGLFGEKFYILKLLHLLIVYLGVFFAIKLIYEILKDKFYAIIIGLTLFTSTVFNYYSFNYLPDAPALGFTFIAWYFTYQFQKNKRTKTLIIAFIFFTLSGLIKVTYLINPFSIIAYAILGLILKHETLITYSNAKKIIFTGLTSTLIIVSWNIYVLYYNHVNHSNSFNTTAQPIWNMSKETFEITMNHMTEYWYNSYFFPSTFHFIYILTFVQILLYKKTDRKLTLLLVLLFLGSFSFLLLFFSQFKDHDYYFITFLPLFLFLLINGFKTMMNFSKNKYIHGIIKVILLTIVISGINYSKKGLGERFEFGKDIYSKTGLIIKKHLHAIKKLNLPNNAKFIVAPDLCPNDGLLYLNKMGWTIHESSEITLKQIRHYQSLGADYLLLVNENSKSDTIGKFVGKKIYTSKEICIYKVS